MAASAHDKKPVPGWVIADGPWGEVAAGIPGYLSQQWVTEAAAALQMPRDAGGAELGARPDELLSSYPTCCIPSNSPGTASTRSLYDFVRCGLEVPSAPRHRLVSDGLAKEFWRKYRSSARRVRLAVRPKY